LAKCVRREVVASLVQLRGGWADSRLPRIRAVYAALAGVGIGYAYDQRSDEAGRQVIRSPEEVLWAPRHGTCLDLAVVFAAACMTAGLHPIIVAVDPADRRTPGHTVVLVRLDQDLTPSRNGQRGTETPIAPPDDLASSGGGAGSAEVAGSSSGHEVWAAPPDDLAGSGGVASSSGVAGSGGGHEVWAVRPEDLDRLLWRD